jgi:hypothetical protein
MIMNKPRNYHLENKDDRIYLDLSCYEADGDNYLKRCCFLNVGHGYELTSKTAETMSKRLLEMSKWLARGESGV